MAELVLRPVINKIVEIAGYLVVQEASSLYWLKRDIDWLQEQLNFMQSYLEVAHAKQAGDLRVVTLSKHIEELALDVEDVLDKFLPQIQAHNGRAHFGRLKNFASFFSSVSNVHKFAMEIKKIKRRVQEIDQARTAFGITEIDACREEDIHEGISRRTILPADEPEIIGQDKTAKKLEARLLDPMAHYDVISIVGMPGLGKTTVAKRIYNCVKGQFDCSAMVYVSQVPKVKGLLQSIARQVGVGENQLQEDLQPEEMQHKLLSILKRKKYVILLDDIWTNAAWDDLRYIFPGHPKIGSRLIITSRNNDVGRYIGGESSLHLLQPLDSKDSMRLFWKTAMKHQEDTDILSDLKDIGRKIVAKCDGVPLAVVLTAGILRARERNERQWSLVLKNMSQIKQEECSRIIALSYKDLPNTLKPCFLYLGLFPEDYEISAVRLINMWVAERFIRANGTQEVEEVGEDYLYKLAARNLVQVVKRGFDGRIKTCRVHDLLHGLCISVARQNNFFQTLDNLERLDPNSIIKVRRLTTHLHHMDGYIALNRQMPKLRALLCFSKSERVEEQHRRTIFGEHRLLRVLRVDFGHSWVSIPQRIRKMRQLSYLEVDGLYNTYSSWFREVKNLQNFYFGVPTNVDSDHIWKMEQLRHLTGVYGHFSPPIQVSLPNLQSLNIRSLRWRPEMLLILKNLSSLRRLRVTGDVECIIETLSGITTMMPKIETLKCDMLYFNSVTSGVNLSSYSNLVCLRLNVILKKLPMPHQFPPNLIKLTLMNSELTEDPMKTLGRLAKLKILKLHGDSYTGRSMYCSKLNSFPQLKVLIMRRLRNLVEVMADDGVLSRLETLVIKDCSNLKRIPERLQGLMENGRPKREHSGRTEHEEGGDDTGVGFSPWYLRR